jgi:VWFA-related protein
MKTPALVLLGLTLLSSAIYSQTAPQTSASDQRSQGQDAPLITINVVRVNLLVSVTDNKGKLITNLKKEDFRVYEDDRLQTIIDFTRETELPLSIALLIDTSGSVIDKLKFEQEAATNFFFNTLRRGKDRARLVAYDSAPYVQGEGFTDHPEELANLLRELRAGGGTAVYDAVRHSVKGLLAKEGPDRRKLIILIGDGHDTQSRFSLTEAIEEAQKSDVTIYAISTNKTSDTRKKEQVDGDKVLTTFVDETGGKIYFPLKIQDLDSDFAKIGEELRSQYVLFYEPTRRQDGSRREIRVEMVDKKYKARARQWYYADAPTPAGAKD